jgi:hypothetical protein
MDDLTSISYGSGQTREDFRIPVSYRKPIEPIYHLYVKSVDFIFIIKRDRFESYVAAHPPWDVIKIEGKIKVLSLNKEEYDVINTCSYTSLSGKL